MADAAQPLAPAALRLVFEWSEAGIRLVDVQRVAKRAPASDPQERAPSAKGSATARTVGMWLEVRLEERSLWRRQVGTMFPDSHEVQTGNPEQPFARVPRTRPFRVEILVPDSGKDAARIVLSERRADPDAKRGAPPREIVHVDAVLDNLARPGTAAPRGE